MSTAITLFVVWFVAELVFQVGRAYWWLWMASREDHLFSSSSFERRTPVDPITKDRKLF